MIISRLTKSFQNAILDWTSVRIATVAIVTVLGSLYTVRHFGGLQPLELAVYDYLVRLSPELSPATEILIVEVKEEDLREYGWPLSDEILAEIFVRLQAHKPSAIGLDIYRDYPVGEGEAALNEQLRQPNVITIRNKDTLGGTPAPPASPPEQVSFNEIPIDKDNVIRRAELYTASPDGETLVSFAMQLALKYLADQGIEPTESATDANVLQLGETPFLPLTPTAGGYHNANTDGYQLLLNYRGVGRVARKMSVGEVLRSDLDSRWIEGKIVLIGSTAPSLRDGKYTPFSPILRGDAQMPGVVVHAQVVSQIVDAAMGDRALFSFWTETQEVIWFAVWALMGSIIAWRIRHPMALLGLTVGSTIIIFTSGYSLFRQGVWIPVATPILTYVLTASVVITYQSYEDNRRHEIVMRLLGQSTSPEIAQALWRGRDKLLKAGKLPGIRLVATMLFLDIRGFSTISETMSPEDLLDWLNGILSEITEEVLKREGIVNKFTGDGVMAVFGVPLTHVKETEVALDARNAVDCALAISDRLHLLNERNRDKRLARIQMRIGIFTGEVVVGSLGGKDRLEYGVLGDSVNTAARLESCVKERQPSDCRILIARDTLNYLGDRYDVESWGPMSLKGKQQMVEVFQVRGYKQGAIGVPGSPSAIPA